jgi:hypothetical protein
MTWSEVGGALRALIVLACEAARFQAAVFLFHPGVETAYRCLSDHCNDLLSSAASDGLRAALETATKSLFPVRNDFNKAHHLV